MISPRTTYWITCDFPGCLVELQVPHVADTSVSTESAINLGWKATLNADHCPNHFWER